MEFENTYEDARRAAAYDELEWGGTYHLIVRDLPGLLREHLTGTRAADFGCGTGRSSRLLRALGFDPVGLDISAEMVARARERDPGGAYQVIEDGDFSSVRAGSRDLVLSAFTFDNIPGRGRKVHLFGGLRELLAPGGKLVSIVSTPEIYFHEWATFTTRDFLDGNRAAGPGDVVRIVTTDYSDARPVDDILWPDAEYREVYAEAGLAVAAYELPLGRRDEGIAWKTETEIAPWAIYVLEAV